MKFLFFPLNSRTHLTPSDIFDGDTMDFGNSDIVLSGKILSIYTTFEIKTGTVNTTLKDKYRPMCIFVPINLLEYQSPYNSSPGTLWFDRDGRVSFYGDISETKKYYISALWIIRG